jgi:hypothetical protein
MHLQLQFLALLPASVSCVATRIGFTLATRTAFCRWNCSRYGTETSQLAAPTRGPTISNEFKLSREGREMNTDRALSPAMVHLLGLFLADACRPGQRSEFESEVLSAEDLMRWACDTIVRQQIELKETRGQFGRLIETLSGCSVPPDDLP